MDVFVAKRRHDLAAGISRGTVQRLGSGRGQLSSLRKALEAAHMDLKGLPPGKTWGERVAALRRRRGLSQNEVAQRAGVGRDAVINLEMRSAGRVDVLRAVLTVLGTKLAFREMVPQRFYTGAALSSVRQDWKTPRWLLEKLYQVFGEFDLDAASAMPPNVRAKVHFTSVEDGLLRPWYGEIVWVNPPYNRALKLWVAKAKREVASGRARTVVGLVPARVGAAWWRQHVVGSASATFLPARLRFDDGQNTAPFDSSLLLWGATEEQVERMVETFIGSWLAYPGPVGRCMEHSACAMEVRTASVIMTPARTQQTSVPVDPYRGSHARAY